MALTRYLDDSILDNIENKSIWPFLVSSSGGRGHNAAMEAIYQHLLNLRNQKRLDFAAEKLEFYIPVLPEHKPRINRQKTQIKLGLDLPQKFKDALDLVGLPVLPDSKEVKNEIKKLAQLNLIERFYVDVLLDIYPAGYEDVAIWNIFQKHDRTDELKKLIELHANSDHNNYKIVRDYFIKRLATAAQNNRPYTEIISTQAMALPAMCDAVIHYNNKTAKKYNAPPILIHQFITDLPTQGAVHFLNPLKRLSTKQRKQMFLYGVNLEKATDFHLPGFAKIISLDPKMNPMVRSGFYDPKLSESILAAGDWVLRAQGPKGEEDKVYKINKTDKIASIMLGSQASDDTIEYVKQLAKSGVYSKIFVFGGTASHLSEGLKECLVTCPENVNIIALDNQDDGYIAPIMCSSNLVIIRGGGLCVMEQLAMPHPPDQIILFHCREDEIGKLTSGILWEDGNVDEAEAYLNEQGIQVRRTTVRLFQNQLNRIQSNSNFSLADDDDTTKAFLKIKLNHLITDLEALPVGAVKTSVLNNLLFQLKKIVEVIDEETVETAQVVLEIAKSLHHAEESQKVYRGRYCCFKSFFKPDHLTTILKHTNDFIKKYYPNAHDKEKEIFYALKDPKLATLVR